jgi:hypothetical protein
MPLTHEALFLIYKSSFSNPNNNYMIFIKCIFAVLIDKLNVHPYYGQCTCGLCSNYSSGDHLFLTQRGLLPQLAILTLLDASCSWSGVLRFATFVQQGPSQVSCTNASICSWTLSISTCWQLVSLSLLLMVCLMGIHNLFTTWPYSLQDGTLLLCKWWLRPSALQHHRTWLWIYGRLWFLWLRLH